MLKMNSQDKTNHTLLLAILWLGLLASCTTQGRSTPITQPVQTQADTATALPATLTPAPSTTPTLAPSLTPAPSATPFAPVSETSLVIKSRFMNGLERVMSVYLPGDYARFPEKRYRVLYAFDAQQLPEIAFEQYMNSLYMARRIEPVIVVAIRSLDGDLRKEELGTGPYLNVFGWGTLSDVFNKFMINELLPKVQETYRTLTGPQNTAVMGWSLGGLSAIYLGWQYPDRFGIVGAFSPSLWWRAESKPGEELHARIIHRIVRESVRRPGLRMWFEAGTAEEPKTDMDMNGTPDVIQDVQDLMKELEKKGYQRDADMVFLKVEGGQHAITTWARVLPDFLQWAFPPQS